MCHGQLICLHTVPLTVESLDPESLFSMSKYIFGFIFIFQGYRVKVKITEAKKVCETEILFVGGLHIEGQSCN